MLRVLLLLALAASSMAAGYAFAQEGTQHWIMLAGAVQGMTFFLLSSE